MTASLKEELDSDAFLRDLALLRSGIRDLVTDAVTLQETGGHVGGWPCRIPEETMDSLRTIKRNVEAAYDGRLRVLVEAHLAENDSA